MIKATTENFIFRANIKHNNRYSYEFSDYINNSTPLTIFCLKHGKFKQKPSEHLRGKGCPKCSGKNKTREQFIDESVVVHGYKYNYDKLVYVNSTTPVIITCLIHGDFIQKPSSHLTGCGCIHCGGNKRLSTDEFIKKANFVHNNKYQYSNAHYINSHTKISITCKEHGEFEQLPNNHLNGANCPWCADIIKSTNSSLTTKQFIEKSQSIHKHKYDYAPTKYVKNNKYVYIRCPKHGVFKQKPNSHLTGCGCNKCAHKISKPEIEIFSFIKTLYNKEIICNSKKIIPPYEIDIYLPKLKIGIEFCGLYWHSNLFLIDDYHINKVKLCEINDIHLITIFEDEWKYKRNIIKNLLVNTIFKNNNTQNNTIRLLNSIEFNDFQVNNSLEDITMSELMIGLFDSDKLISIMGLNQIDHNLNINIFTSIVGESGFSKILKHIIKNYKPTKINVFGNLRFINRKENIYIDAGFTEKSIVSPDYFYVKNEQIRYNKNNIIKNQKYNKIFDCGMIEYEYTS